MNEHDDRVWGEAGAGLRPSTLLAVGALLLVAGPLLARILPASTIPWLVWEGGLLVTAAGLLASAMQPWASAMVAVTGLFFLVQAVALAAALLEVEMAARAHHLLTIPKMLALGLLAVTERRQHGRHRCLWLAGAGLLGLVRIGWRTLSPQTVMPVWVDVAVAVALATALWIFARGLRRRENEWARRRCEEASARLEDFNRTGAIRP